MREFAKVLAGVLLAIALLWLVLHGVDRAALLGALKRASLVGLMAGAIINVGHNLFRVWRWGALLAPVRPHVRFRPMATAVMVGYLTTWVLPGRLGELVRPALLSARENVPLGPSLGSVVADRLLDGAAIVALFAAGSFLLPLSGEAAVHLGLIRSSAVVMLVIIVTGLALLVAAAGVRHHLETWMAGRRRVLRWLGRSFLSLAGGTEALRRPALLLRIAALSLLAWLTIALGTWLGVRASGARIPFEAILILLPLLAFGVAVPTPGGAGGYHAAMTFGLEMLFGVPAGTAVAAGILMHLAVVVPVILIGTVLLRTERISWRDMISAARQVRSLGAGGEAAHGSRHAEESP